MLTIGTKIDKSAVFCRNDVFRYIYQPKSACPFNHLWPSMVEMSAAMYFLQLVSPGLTKLSG
uniref:Uncharacterized protein n=1 Tax=Arundo donax TaxID=35708 RepID=A0A0A9A7V5_ARUDO